MHDPWILAGNHGPLSMARHVIWGHHSSPWNTKYHMVNLMVTWSQMPWQTTWVFTIDQKCSIGYHFQTFKTEFERLR